MTGTTTASTRRVEPAKIHPLLRYILVRIGISLLLAVGITLVTFVLTNLMPADPVAAARGEGAGPDPAKVEAMRERLGLDKPLPEQYFLYLSNLVQGDWGNSIQTQKPVLLSIQQAFPASIELGIGAILIAVTIGLLLGLLSALRRNTWVDHIIRTISLVGVSAPTFWIAAVAYSLFFFQLRIAPSAGRLDATMVAPPYRTGMYTVDAALAGDWATFGNALSHLILPSIVLALFTIGLLTRFTRSSVLDVLNLEYVQAAKAKGLPRRTVIWGYIFRGALVPIITVIGLTFGSLLSGAVLTETVFAWNGIGQLAYRGATSLDLPVIMGVSLIIGVVYIIVNLLTDIVYGLVDPRVRVQ